MQNSVVEWFLSERSTELYRYKSRVFWCDHVYDPTHLKNRRGRCPPECGEPKTRRTAGFRPPVEPRLNLMTTNQRESNIRESNCLAAFVHKLHYRRIFGLSDLPPHRRRSAIECRLDRYTFMFTDILRLWFLPATSETD